MGLSTYRFRFCSLRTNYKLTAYLGGKYESSESIKNAVTFFMTDKMYHAIKSISKIEKLTLGEFMRDAVELALA